MYHFKALLVVVLVKFALEEHHQKVRIN